MKVTETDLICYCDVDGILVNKLEKSEAGTRSADYYGKIVPILPLWKNINFLISLKARGYYIIVHSNNGFLWAKNIVEALELQNYVDEVKSKPAKVLDDEEPIYWMRVLNLESEKESW